MADPLGPSRGCLVAILFAVVMWAGIAWLVSRV